MLLEYMKPVDGDAFPRPVVEEVMRDWIDHRLPGEPDLLTQARPAYVRHHLQRALAAIALVPRTAQRGRLLELGSGIYLMTFLLERLTNYDLDLVQYWGQPSGAHRSVLVNARTGARRTMPFREFNAETEAFPYGDATFDVIVNCDAIEHLLCNPVHMLAECHRVLKPDATMVITTPNVLRIDNVVKLLRGHNIYDKYVLESASARHPREYTPDELAKLVESVGFSVQHLETRDVSAPGAGPWARKLARCCAGAFAAMSGLTHRTGEHPLASRGEQIILVARRTRAVNREAPEFLYEAPGASRQLIEALYREEAGA